MQRSINTFYTQSRHNNIFFYKLGQHSHHRYIFVRPHCRRSRMLAIDKVNGLFTTRKMRKVCDCKVILIPVLLHGSHDS